jgi:hypothetical protein
MQALATPKPISAAQAKRNEKAAAIADLQKWYPRGSQVFTIVRHVSASGMSRNISVLALTLDALGDNPARFIHPNWAVSKAIGWPTARSSGAHDAIAVKGCGMDMAEHLVQTLSYALYGEPNALCCVKL